VRKALLLALLMSVASATGAQDRTGLAGLPQGTVKAGVARAEAERAKSMMSSSTDSMVTGARSAQAPIANSADPILGIARHPEAASAGPRAGCERSTADLCYDVADHHIVYRPARQFMPGFRGLTAENISVRRNGIRVKYSFP
jgi:hypothetical protein